MNKIYKHTINDMVTMEATNLISKGYKVVDIRGFIYGTFTLEQGDDRIELGSDKTSDYDNSIDTYVITMNGEIIKTLYSVIYKDTVLFESRDEAISAAKKSQERKEQRDIRPMKFITVTDKNVKFLRNIKGFKTATADTIELQKFQYSNGHGIYEITNTKSNRYTEIEY